jgi:hypothetical protein
MTEPTTNPAPLENNQIHPVCWVLDDEWQRYPRRFWGPSLTQAGYQVRYCTTANKLVAQVLAEKENRQANDLVLIDISLDESMPTSINAYDVCVQQALAKEGTPAPFHGQAVGLWLWDQRHSLRLPYAYVSNHPGLFVKQLAFKPEDPEFGGRFDQTPQGGSALLFNRGHEGDIAQCVLGVLARWQAEQWIKRSGGTA